MAAGAAVPVVTFAIDSEADVRATDVETTAEGSRFTCVVEGRHVAVRVPITGRYNVANALGTMAAFHALGLPLEAAADGIAKLGGVPGRLEAVDVGPAVHGGRRLRPYAGLARERSARRARRVRGPADRRVRLRRRSRPR